MRIDRLLAIAGLSLAATALVLAQDASFTVTLVPPIHGKVELRPPLSAEGRYPAGTVVTLTATPDAGYALDSAWYSVPGRFGQMYHEEMARDFKVTIDQEKRVGASFIEEAALKDLVVTHDVVYAKPGVKALKYDVFAPRGARNLPVIVIVHGGGWTTNDEDIMRGLARELVRGGAFVAASIDYRWLGKADGDAAANTMSDLVGDVFGAIAHVMEHAAQYGGDPTRIGLTGDSAGGHLVAVASLMTGMIGSRGFGRTAGVFEFMPSYLPSGKTAEQVRVDLTKAIKAAAPSYGVFSASMLKNFAANPAGDDSWVDAVAPLVHVPAAAERAVPQFLTRGTRDPLISDSEVRDFTEALVKAGQRAEYLQVGGASHAFFDWKPDDRTKETFARYGVYYAQSMKAFFASVFAGAGPSRGTSELGAGAAQPPANRPPPPVRDPRTPGYVTATNATELADGAVPPVTAIGNFILGPTHPPAAEVAVQPGVPRGAVHEFIMNSVDSRIYPGIARAEGTRPMVDPKDPARRIVTSGPAPYSRRVAVYVPQQYTPGTVAPFIVGADGPDPMLFTTLDNLIAQKRVPVMIGISIANGSGDAQGSQRGLEYDTMSGRYAEFVESEVLPLVEKQYHVRLTKDPKARATMGCSSGGAAALAMAWYRTDLYQRVLAYSGTFVNQQWPYNPETPGGAWEFHRTLIPGSPAKPIRLWLHVSDRDNFNDSDGMHDWVLANQLMAQALASKGYKYQFVFARNAGHCDRSVKEQTLAQALEWVWKD